MYSLISQTMLPVLTKPKVVLSKFESYASSVVFILKKTWEMKRVDYCDDLAPAL
jgi:hypothetical protein